MAIGFDAKNSAGYDDRVAKMIPGYEVMHRLARVALAAELKPNAKILMIGTGTGAEVLECGVEQPTWSITAIEPSKDMSKTALEKIKAKGLSERVVWHEGTLDTLKGEEAFDAATALLVLHFVPDDGEKLELLTQIMEYLQPGAPLILSAFAGDPQATRTRKLYDLSKATAIAQGMDPKEVAERYDLGRKDIHLVPEERIKSLLREAGYIDVQRLFQSLAMITWIARTQR